MPTQMNELNFEGQNIFAGFDVHLKSWKVTILNLHNLPHRNSSIHLFETNGMGYCIVKEK